MYGKTFPNDESFLRPLCPMLVKKSTNTKGVMAISSRISKVVRRVALPLLSVSITCRGEEADKAVTVLLDTDSQATLVKISVVNRLDLPSEVG